MTDTVAGLREVARRMRRLGHQVEFVPSWERRGAGAVRARAKVNHHTAGSQRGGAAASLRICTFGREGLRNALCNTYSDRSARLYIVAAGLAWHAGLGSWRGVAGNSGALGHEAENDGVGEPWSREHLQLLEDLDRVQSQVFGYGVRMVCEHKEWSPGRKIDRHGINGDRWRHRVAARPKPAPDPDPEPPTVDHKPEPRPRPPAVEDRAEAVPDPRPTAPTKKPKAAKAPTWEEQLVAKLRTVKKGSRGIAVKRVQALLLAAGHGPKGLVNRAGKPDGRFGPGTHREALEFQRSRNLAADGIIGRNTWSKLLGV